LAALGVSPSEEQEDEVEVVVPIQHRLMEVVEVVGKAMEEGVVAVALVDQAFLDVHVQEVQEAFRAFLVLEASYAEAFRAFLDVQVVQEAFRAFLVEGVSFPLEEDLP